MEGIAGALNRWYQLMPGMLLALRFAGPDVSQRISPVGWCYLFDGIFVIFDFCCVHVLSSGLAPRAAFGGQNFSVRACGWHWVYPPVDIRAHSKSFKCLRQGEFWHSFWCVGHRILHSTGSASGSKKGSPRQRFVPARSRTHVCANGWVFLCSNC